MEPSPNLRQGGPSSIEQVPLILLGSKEGSASISRKGGEQSQWTNTACWLSQALAGQGQVDTGEHQTQGCRQAWSTTERQSEKPRGNGRAAELSDCSLRVLSKARFWRGDGLGFPMRSFLCLAQSPASPALILWEPGVPCSDTDLYHRNTPDYESWEHLPYKILLK